MQLGAPVPPELLRTFKESGRGLAPRQAGERIIQSILEHFRAEVTVLDSYRTGELFRIGMGFPSHGIHGVHVHPVFVQWDTWELRAHKDAVALLKDADFNMYLGTLLQALQLGRYRVGLPR